MRKIIGKRLEEERIRLGKKKGEMAAIGGVAGSAYTNYLEGNRAPDAEFLSAIAAAGADVNYILTGTRTQAVAPLPDALSADEAQLLRHYRQLASAIDKAMVQRVLVVAVAACKHPTAPLQPAPDKALAPPPPAKAQC